VAAVIVGLEMLVSRVEALPAPLVEK